MNEAQGVEFDVVCIVGVDLDMFSIEYNDEYKEYANEKKRINKDLLYVALTRAINSLHIIGKASLKDMITW
jgi:superfamily I DNA/RNA helicase